MRIVFFISALLMFPVFFPVVGAAEKESGDKLADAWTEYKLGEYASAEKMFTAAAGKAKTNDAYCEAMTGLAFCSQFAKKQQTAVSDYRHALECYEKALSKIGESSKYTPFIKSMMAECFFNIHKMNPSDADSLARAEKLWKEVQKTAPGTLAAEDSLLFEVVAGTGNDYSSPKAAKLAKKLERYLNGFSERENGASDMKKSRLRSVMCAYLADYHCWRGDRRGQVKWLIRYCDNGATSYAAKADALFKIARTAEVKLKDAKLALKYYRRFLKEIGSDARRYLAQERIKAISNGGVK